MNRLTPILLALSACGGNLDHLDAAFDDGQNARVDANDCAFGGAYDATLDVSLFLGTCDDSRVGDEARRAADARIELSYDAESDVVRVTGPFGARFDSATVELRSAASATDRYVGTYERRIPNPYSASFPPLEYAVTIEVARAAVHADRCDVELIVLPKIGFSGGFWCQGRIDAFLQR